MPTAPVLLIHGVGSSFEHNWRATGWVDLLEDEGGEIAHAVRGPSARFARAVERRTKVWQTAGRRREGGEPADMVARPIQVAV